VRELNLASRGVKFVEAIEEVIDIELISGPGTQVSDWSFAFLGENEHSSFAFFL
jgi:hypothetical protein